jgi:hypothetical protein
MRPSQARPVTDTTAWQRSCPDGDPGCTSEPVNPVLRLILTCDFSVGEDQTFSRPRNTPERGHRFHERKSALTCGAPLRNRTVDLLLTMYRSAVPQLQVGQPTCQNTSGGKPSQALDELSRALFATRYATHFDLDRLQRASRPTPLWTSSAEWAGDLPGKILSGQRGHPFALIVVWRF